MRAQWHEGRIPRGNRACYRPRVRILAASCLLAAAVAQAAVPERFRDPEDGQLDASEYLLDHSGALPVPIIITEPAVGYGGGLGLAWFSESIRDAIEHSTGGKLAPPNIYGAMAFGTENGTKGGGVGARTSFDQGRWLYRGVGLATSVNIDFYGIGGDLAPGLTKVGYNLKGAGTFQELTRRIGDTDFMIGGRFLYLDLTTRLDVGLEDAHLTPREVAHRTSELGMRFQYDSRDNIFTTTRGIESAVDLMWSEPGFGSDNTFRTLRTHAFAFAQPVESLVTAMRLDYRGARGDIPFYQLPYIDMRGIPAARYQDENTAIVEGELRYYATPRWILVGFMGAGRAWGTKTAFDDAGSQVSKGVGFRYMVAKRLKLAIGIDVARGPEKTAYYLQFGNSWR